MLSGSSKIHNDNLPVIAIAAVVQGWALYALHLSIKGAHWPATQPAWLLALYAVALFIPPTIQLNAAHARSRPAWLIVAVMTALFFYFGWHHGARVMDRSAGNFISSGDWFPMALVLGVLWLMMLPFVQCRLTDGQWRARYEALFATAWRNKLVLAEAALFTGLFWLLLFLWQALFVMLGISFFKELFEEPIFVYPVTSLTFGLALHLIGSLDRLTSVVLEQLLNVLKWLAIVAGLILTLFTLALIFKLPGMIASGERAISAAWLLWLVAVTVLLVNAAYRDGSVEAPYPKWIAFALRCVIPLIVVIALTALYAMYLRIDAYGFTVERVWACIVAGAACIYAIGYALASRSAGRWMAGVARINVITALFLIAAISLALTPVLSPYRIAANSQFRLAQEAPREAVRNSDRTSRGTPMHYLRFNAGEYGLVRLRELSKLQEHPRASQIRSAAVAMLEQEQPWEPAMPINLRQRLASMVVHPSGRAADAQLLERLEADLRDPEFRWIDGNSEAALGGVFVDLNADQQEEFVLIAAGPASAALAYRNNGGAWKRIGVMRPDSVGYDQDMATQIGAGSIAVQEPAWRELTIGRHTFRMTGAGAR